MIAAGSPVSTTCDEQIGTLLATDSSACASPPRTRARSMCSLPTCPPPAALHARQQKAAHVWQRKRHGSPWAGHGSNAAGGATSSPASASAGPAVGPVSVKHPSENIATPLSRRNGEAGVLPACEILQSSSRGALPISSDKALSLRLEAGREPAPCAVQQSTLFSYFPFQTHLTRGSMDNSGNGYRSPGAPQHRLQFRERSREELRDGRPRCAALSSLFSSPDALHWCQSTL
mmetsp:Transcript_11488/g.27247  ORF Transcript_11488/g.27247 Transcript_11488/m.27247 type:complete len:232 (+) Transcript_11488:252-947(+)